MAYTFHSRATADLIMLASTAKKILELLGKTPGEPGIVTVAQIPEALRILEQAVLEDDERRKQLHRLEQSEDGRERAQAAALSAELGAISLRQRVAPLADMLRRSAAEGKDVTWTVAATK